MSPAALKAPIVGALHQLLRPEGFRKTGSVFSRSCADVVHLIEVQGSRTNLAGDARFTINVAVFAPAVLYPDIRDITKPSVGLAHWRERIGFLGNEQVDLWWNVHNDFEAQEAAAELTQRVRTHALPALAKLPNLASLVELWRTGRSPGVPPKLRDDFLSRALAAAANSAA